MAILWNTKDVWLNTYRGVNYERMLKHGHTLDNQGDAVAKEGYERGREESHWGSDTKEMQGVT